MTNIINEHIDFHSQIETFISDTLNINFNDTQTNNSTVNKPKELFEIIFKSIINPKFRRTALDQDSFKDIETKLNTAIINSLPIEFTIPFGGYKNCRLPSFPEPDWAEVFNIRYMIKYLLPITEIYGPGVSLYYSYNRNIINKVNNIPLSIQNTYEQCFTKLISYYLKGCPDNFKIKLMPINDLYEDEHQWENELHELILRNQNNWSDLYDSVTRSKKIESAKHNFMIKGEKDFTQLSKFELEDKYLEAAMICDAIDSLSKRREFNKYSNKHQLVFIRGPKPSIHVGACEGSTMHFWVGHGVLTQSKNKFLPKIISYSQYFNELNKIKYIRTDNKLISISSNYSTIPFLDNTFN